MLIKFNMNKENFKNDFLYKMPYVFKKAIDINEFNWNNANEIYSRGDISHRDFKLMNGYEVPKQEYVESYDNLGVTEYRCITSTLYKYLRDGATLVLNRIKNEPFIDEISRQIGSFAEARTITGGYAAFSSRSSYKSHWDTRDVYAVQLLGRKRWILKRPNFDFPLYMQQTKNFPHIEEPKEVYMDVVLEAGDILYIPRGWWHDPLPLDEETFHLAVATFAPTGFEYIQWLQSKTHNLIDCRKNFLSFDKDREILENISNKFSEIIKNKASYEAFMMNHLENHQISSTLSLDVLGNGKVNELDPNQKICINANLIYIFEDNSIIVNGNQLKVDTTSLEIIKYIYEHPYSTVTDIYSKFGSNSLDKIKKFIFKLSLENIISIVA